MKIPLISVLRAYRDMRSDRECDPGQLHAFVDQRLHEEFPEATERDIDQALEEVSDWTDGQGWLIDWGVSVRSGWLTPLGEAELEMLERGE